MTHTDRGRSKGRTRLAKSQERGLHWLAVFFFFSFFFRFFFWQDEVKVSHEEEDNNNRNRSKDVDDSLTCLVNCHVCVGVCVALRVV